MEQKIKNTRPLNCRNFTQFRQEKSRCHMTLETYDKYTKILPYFAVFIHAKEKLKCMKTLNTTLPFVLFIKCLVDTAFKEMSN